MENKTEFKVKDRVMMVGTVERIEKGEHYPLIILTDGGDEIGFTIDGKDTRSDNNPCLQPYTEPFREREMMVSNDEKKWVVRLVVSNICNRFQATPIDISNSGVGNWKFAKEIEEPKTEETPNKDELLNACKWALEQFKRLADEGKYPDFMLSQNGGEGVMPLVNAIKNNSTK